MALNYDICINYIQKGSPSASLSGMSQRVGQAQKAFDGLERSRKKAFSSSVAGNILGGDMKGVADLISTGFTGAANAVSGLADSLKSVTLGMATVVAGGLGAGLIKGIGINQELQDLKISLAATFQANYGINPFTQALSAADSMMQKLRKDANDLPGTLEDLGGIFKSIAPVSGNLGLTPAQTEAIAAKSMAAGKVSGLSGPVIGREMSLLLSGNAHANNVLGVRLGLDMKKLNKMNGTDRVKTLTDSLARYDDAIVAFSHSYSGVSTTFADNAKMFLGALTQPAFDKIVSMLEKANTWWSINRRSALASAHDIGEAFVRGFEKVEDKIKSLIPVVQHVVEYIKDLDFGDVAKKGAAGFLGLKVGAAAMRAAPALMSMPMAELTAALAALGPVAVVAAAGLLAVVAALAAMESSNKTISAESNMAWRSITKSASDFYDTNIASMQELKGNVEALIVGPFSLLGVSILDLGAGMATLAKGMDLVKFAVQGVLTPVLGGAAAPAAELLTMGSRLGQGRGKRLGGVSTGGLGGFNESDAAPKVVNHNTTVNGGIHLHVEGKQEDPNRIARLVMDKFQQTIETPTKSSKAGKFSNANRPS